MSISFSDRVAGLFEPTETGPVLPDVDEDLDTLLSLIKNERRRLVIQIVAELGDDTITRREIAKRIAGIQNGVDEAHLTNKEYKAVYVGLYQEHLPKLTDYGIVRFRGDSDRLEATEMTRDVADLIHALELATGGDAR